MAFERDSSWRPDTGSLVHTFNFSPLHYGTGGDAQRAFKAKIREELERYGFLLCGEVQVGWKLFVDEQDRWESDTGADVDNFAKLLNDALLGTKGLLFDDVQVQSLDIRWLPMEQSPSFELQVECHPDEHVTRPASFYEMAGGLWYPISAQHNPALPHLLYGLDDSAWRIQRVRHHFRANGVSRRDAFLLTKFLQTTLRGFHRTRATSSDFVTTSRKDWKQEHARPSDLPAPSDDKCRQMAVQLAQSLRK